MGPIAERAIGRAFSLWYGPAIALIDARGLRQMRRAALAGAAGRVLELGSGRGANLGLYPSAVTELLLSEPSAPMRRALRRRARRRGLALEPIACGAEGLPFADRSFDCLTATMVLCTMPDPAAGLAEVARVLRPGGRFLFLEHVRSAEPRLARRQDRLAAPWRLLAAGCRCNQDTRALIEASPLRLASLEAATMPSAPAFMSPLIFGSALAPQQA
jgi:ubiquinone/menaquinone biosynthesis C-methylase UbiE